MLNCNLSLTSPSKLIEYFLFTRQKFNIKQQNKITDINIERNNLFYLLQKVNPPLSKSQLGIILEDEYSICLKQSFTLKFSIQGNFEREYIIVFIY